MNWIFLPLIAAFLWALVNLVDKIIVTKLVSNPVTPVILSGVVSLAAGLLVYFLHGFALHDPLLILLGLVAGCMTTLLNYFYFKAMQIEEASRISPLLYLSVFFVFLVATFMLHEALTTPQIIGVLLLMVGAFLISMKEFKGWRFSKALWMIILGAIAITVNQILTKYLLGFTDYWTVFGIIRFGTFISTIPFFIRHRKTLFDRQGYHASFAVLAIIVSESVTLIGTALFNAASSQGPITIAMALASVQPFFVFLLAALISIFFPHIIKETLDRRHIAIKLVAIAFMFLGIQLIT